MKKIVVILLSLFLLSGCGAKNNTDVLKEFKEEINKKDSYIIKGEMVIVSNEDKFTYDVEASNKENNYYKVNLINKTNNHEQVILKNSEAVYVVTPSLNKSFKFQSEWPNNGSQVYLLDSLVRDIDSDKEASSEKNDEGFVITTKVNYPNNSTLVNEKIYTDKKYQLKKVEVLDSDGNSKITFEVKNIDYNPSFNKEYFDLDLLIDTDCCENESTTNKSSSSSTTTTTKPNENTTTTSPSDNTTTESNNSSTDETTTSNILDDIIYPLYIPTDTYLSTKDTINTDDGNRVILTFAGEKPFMLVEEMSVRSSEFEVIPVYGDPLMMSDNIGALSANSLYWTSNNIDYYITSDSLSGEELLTIAEGLGNSSLVVNGEK